MRLQAGAVEQARAKVRDARGGSVQSETDPPLADGRPGHRRTLRGDGEVFLREAEGPLHAKRRAPPRRPRFRDEASGH